MSDFCPQFLSFPWYGLVTLIYLSIFLSLLFLFEVSVAEFGLGIVILSEVDSFQFHLLHFNLLYLLFSLPYLKTRPEARMRSDQVNFNSCSWLEYFESFEVCGSSMYRTRAGTNRLIWEGLNLKYFSQEMSASLFYIISQYQKRTLFPIYYYF